MLSYSYDLIICDSMLPSMPGIEICKRILLKAGGTALVLMLLRAERIKCN